MFETGLLAFTTFFAVVSPVDVAVLFAALTAHAQPGRKLVMAARGVLIAGAILVAFALFGNKLLELLGITLAALRTAGGVLLLLMAIDMVFARPSGGITTTDDEDAEAGHRHDISVFPLATPLIAGPGAMGAAILLYAQAAGDPAKITAVFTALALVLALTFALLLAASRLSAFLGVTGQNVITRVFGILLAALAVQFIFDGVRESGLIGG
ncbi:MAG: MarC family protein [Rhodospirillales bacterium]|nr:MarC family protein [Rhodospirillales bacterium]MSP79787.1 MarC family protein [Rhodospirillales bacterium]